MKHVFEEPIVEIVMFSVEDIMTASSDSFDDSDTPGWT